MNDTAEKKVLVVDDSMRIRTSVMRMVMTSGIKSKILMAKDGEDAIHQINKIKPDIVITDTGMPRKDGFDLIKHLRKDPGFKKLPIIVIAAFLTLDEQDLLRELRVNDIVIKPLHDQEFINAFQGCFEGYHSEA